MKSAHHTRFGPSACGQRLAVWCCPQSLLAGYYQSFSLQQLADRAGAGQLRPGSSRSSTCFSFRGPQLMCACRNSSIYLLDSAAVWFGCRCVARLAPPGQPAHACDTAATIHTRFRARNCSVRGESHCDRPQFERLLLQVARKGCSKSHNDQPLPSPEYKILRGFYSGWCMFFHLSRSCTIFSCHEW